MRVVNFSAARNHLKNVVYQTVADADFTKSWIPEWGIRG
jgi:hypothetical protein